MSDTRRDPGYLLRVYAEHERLIDAVEARDEAAACQALHDHLHTRDYVNAEVTHHEHDV